MKDLLPLSIWSWGDYQRGDEILVDNSDSVKLGSVYFSVVNLPGQCGACVLYDFQIERGKRLPNADQFIASLRHYLKDQVGIVLASDVVGSRMHKFLNRSPWQKGKIVTNPNSGNKIQVFELEI